MKKCKSFICKITKRCTFSIILILSIFILIGCTDQQKNENIEISEVGETMSEEPNMNKDQENPQQLLEEQKRQELSNNIEKNMVKYLGEERYKEIISYYKNEVFYGSDKKLKLTDKSNEIYNIAIRKYFEEKETFEKYYDYQILSLDKGDLKQEVKEFIYEKFAEEIVQVEEVLEKEKADQQQRILDNKVLNEERAELKRAEEKAKREEEIKNRVYIGMTQEEVLATNWGKPDDINRTITVNGVSEQWVYSKYDKYLYFDNGILITIQE